MTKGRMTKGRMTKGRTIRRYNNQKIEQSKGRNFQKVEKRWKKDKFKTLDVELSFPTIVFTLAPDRLAD